jgi:hypothetical protein
MKTFYLAALALALAPAPALADAISLASTDIGKSFSVAYNGFDGSGSIGGLTGSTQFTLTGVTANSFTFSYAIGNTSAAPITASRISGFGFNTDPSISGATSSGTFNTVGTAANVPNVGSVDVCFKDGGGTNSCAGGGGGGVSIGDSGAGLLTLNFASALSSLNLSDFFVRYQSIAGTAANTPSSAVGTGTISSTGGSSGGTPVPEPGAVILFLLAMAALVLYKRRAANPALAFA